MRLRATRLSATGNNGGSPYLPEAVEFISRAAVTESYSKWSINEFVKGAKLLGIWDKLVYVPCLPSMGGLNQIGGAAQRTNTPWTLVNATSVPEGVAITLNGFSNHLLSDQLVSNVSQPIAFGSFACQTTTPKYQWFDYTTLSLSGTSQRTVGQEFWSNPHRANLRYAHNSFLSATPLTGSSFGYNNYKQSHLMAVDATNGSTAYSIMCDEVAEARTAGGALNYNTPTKMRFYPAVNQYSTGTGWVQGAFLYYGAFTEAGYEAWRKFRALVAQTFLSGTVGHRRLLLAGQSNAAGNLALEISRQSTEDFGMFSVFNTGFGGQPISTWIGDVGSNARTSVYRNAGQGFWGTSGTLPAFQRSRIAVGRYQEYLVWFQGEADLDPAKYVVYQQQLATLINYFREDTGNPELKVIVVQIDYAKASRNGNSNLVVSGFTGGLTGLNGTYLMTALTTELDPYVWTKAGYRVEQQSGKWVFIETTGSTVLVTENASSLPHPAMVSDWVDAGSVAVTPTFGTVSLVESIERIRYAQREICNDLPNVYTFDSRGYTRTDNVHIDNAAHITFATDLNTYLLTI